ncbi:hypothetical protein [Actinomadura sp. 9N407]
MRNLVTPDQSWTLQSEAAEAQQAEVAEIQELDESVEFEQNVSLSYARI